MTVGVLGCLLALVVGVAVASDSGLQVIGILVGTAFAGVAVAIYVRDPIRALMFLWVIVLFDTPLSAIAGYNSSTGQHVRQADELLVLLLVALTLWRTIRTRAPMPPRRFIVPGIGVALTGLLGAVANHVPLIVSVSGAWLGLKFWIMVGVTLALPWKRADIHRVYSILTRVGAVVAVVGLVDYFTNAAVSSALHTSTFNTQLGVYRGNSVHSILPRPGEYSLFVSLLFAVTFSRFAMKRERSDLALALLFAISVVLSLRLKGFLSLAGVAIIIMLAQGAIRRRRNVTVLLIGSLLLIGGYSVERSVIAKQVSIYTSSEASVRADLYSTGKRIADDEFPLGVGFGRFGSYPSRLYYSPVYDQYHLSSIYGLSRLFPDYINDTTWPSVMAETGYVGLAVYLVGIVVLALAVIRRFRTTAVGMKWLPLAALCAIAVLLIDSLGAPTLFDWLGAITFALVLGPALIVARPEEEALSP